MADDWKSDYQTTQKFYEDRINDVHSVSKEVQMMSSKLEQEEAQLLKDLETTQGYEIQQIEKLKAMDNEHSQKYGAFSGGNKY